MTESAGRARVWKDAEAKPEAELPGLRRASQRGLWGDALRRLRMNKGAMISLALLLLLLIPVFFASQIAPYDPIQMDPDKLFRAAQHSALVWHRSVWARYPEPCHPRGELFVSVRVHLGRHRLLVWDHSWLNFRLLWRLGRLCSDAPD